MISGYNHAQLSTTSSPCGLLRSFFLFFSSVFRNMIFVSDKALYSYQSGLNRPGSHIMIALSNIPIPPYLPALQVPPAYVMIMCPDTLCVRIRSVSSLSLLKLEIVCRAHDTVALKSSLCLLLLALSRYATYC